MAQLKQPLHPDDCAAFFLALVLSGEHLACLHVYFLKSAPPTGIGGSGTSSILFALRPKNDAAHVRDDYSILSESRLVENREVRHIRVLI